jgi:thioester reductase-like protein
MPHIFLTGGTGVIGSALIPQLLDQHDVQLTVLLRAKSHEELQQRAQQLVEFCEVGDEAAADRIRFIAGDVCCENLGVSGNEYADLVNTVTGIVHSAGNVKLNQPLETARRNAVDSAQHILNLAGRAKRLRKIDVVSTIGVAGRMPGVIPERRLNDPREFHNNYEQAKAEAEEVVWNAIDDGLPITIHRPSMVVGDSQSGEIIHFQVFYYLCDFLSGRRSSGFLPHLGNIRLDTIPVDYVARSICITNGMVETRGKVFHLCSGPEKSVPLREVVASVRRLEASRGIEGQRLKYMPRWLFRQAVRVMEHFVPKAQRRILETVPYFLEYLYEDQLFDVQRTSEFLGALGLVIPEFRHYVDAILEYRLDQMHRVAQRSGDLNNAAERVLAAASG